MQKAYLHEIGEWFCDWYRSNYAYWRTFAGAESFVFSSSWNPHPLSSSRPEYKGLYAAISFHMKLIDVILPDSDKLLPWEEYGNLFESDQEKYDCSF